MIARLRRGVRTYVRTRGRRDGRIAAGRADRGERRGRRGGPPNTGARARCCWWRRGCSPRMCPGCPTTRSTRTSCCRCCCRRCCTRPRSTARISICGRICGPSRCSRSAMSSSRPSLVGYLAYLLVPDLPLTAALVLGAVVAPPDAVAATAIARRLGLPNRITTILQGESLVNDATAITAYKVALAAAVGEGASWAGGIAEFALASLGGVAVGLVADGADPLAAHPPEGSAAAEHALAADPVRRLRGGRAGRARPGCSPWSSSRSISGTAPGRSTSRPGCRRRRSGRWSRSSWSPRSSR